MGPSKAGPRIRIVSSSGMLRVTIPPRRSWLLMLLEIAVVFAGMAWAYSLWMRISTLFHVLFVWALVSTVLAFIYQFSATQVVEFDSQRMTLCKEIHGWERKKDYKIQECSELEWSAGAEGEPDALKCSVRRGRITVCRDVSLKPSEFS
jgi:hypothetical protein